MSDAASAGRCTPWPPPLRRRLPDAGVRPRPRARATRGSTTPRWRWSCWSWSATRGRCCRKNGLNDHLYDFLYAWHVPAFVFVTGYLSRSFTWAPRRMWQLVRTVVVPYVLFECALALFRIYVGGEKLEDLFQRPALADVVPRGPVLLAAAHPDLHQAAHRGGDRRRGGDQPRRRRLRRRHPRHGPGARAAAVLRAGADGDQGAARAAARAVGPQRRAAGLPRDRGGQRPGPTRWRRPSGSTTAPSTASSTWATAARS